jgi:hypothetical protein
MNFSQRMGITPVRTALQVDGMDQPLKNELWNFLWAVFLNDLYKLQFNLSRKEQDILVERIWAFHWHRPLDDIPRDRREDRHVTARNASLSRKPFRGGNVPAQTSPRKPFLRAESALCGVRCQGVAIYSPPSAWATP